MYLLKLEVKQLLELHNLTNLLLVSFITPEVFVSELSVSYKLRKQFSCYHSHFPTILLAFNLVSSENSSGIFNLLLSSSIFF